MENRNFKKFEQLYKELNFTKISEITDLLRDLNNNNYNSIISRYHIDNISLKSQQLLIEAITINVLVRNDQDFNHRLTPQIIGLIYSEIITSINSKSTINIVDLGSGTGNLIFSILDNFKDITFNTTIIDNNEEMIKFSQQYRKLFHFQNNLKFMFDDVISYQPLEKIDFVISDMPVGYYPQNKNILNYQVKISDDLTYVQNLFIEKSLRILKHNSFAILTVPQNIFTSKQSSVLLKVVKESAYIQGIIGLPLNSFTDKKFRKYIIILQKKGDWAHQMTPVLLYNLENLDDIQSYRKLLITLQAWGEEIKKRGN
ncbi:MAG: methyltransferase domain-containing protein [Lactobacillaceae bacterium]